MQEFLQHWTSCRLVVRPDEFKALDGKVIVDVSNLSLSINLGRVPAEHGVLSADEYCRARTRASGLAGDFIDTLTPLQLEAPLLVLKDENGEFAVLDGLKRGNRLLKEAKPISAVIVASDDAEAFINRDIAGPLARLLSFTVKTPIPTFTPPFRRLASDRNSEVAPPKKDPCALLGIAPPETSIGRGKHSALALKLEGLMILHGFELVERRQAEAAARKKSNGSAKKFDPIDYLNSLTSNLECRWNGQLLRATFPSGPALAFQSLEKRRKAAEQEFGDFLPAIRAKPDAVLIEDFVILSRARFSAIDRDSGLRNLGRGLSGKQALDETSAVTSLRGDARFDQSGALAITMLSRGALISGEDLSELQAGVAHQKSLIYWWSYFHHFEKDPMHPPRDLYVLEQFLHWRAVEMTGDRTFLANAWRELFRRFQETSVACVGKPMNGLDFTACRALESLVTASGGSLASMIML